MPTSNLIIKRIDWRDYTYDFKDGAYSMSYVVMDNVQTRAIQLTTSGGEVGWGEIARKPDIELDQVESLEREILDTLVGQDLGAVVKKVRELQGDQLKYRGLAFGLETACLDLIARKARLPMHDLLGGRLNQSVPEYTSISCTDNATFESIFNRETEGRKVLQLKLGINSLDDDHNQVRMAIAALNDNQTLLVDFNGALSPDIACEFIAEFRDAGLIWEEPCATIDENLEVAQRSGRQIMFDQCLRDVDVIAEVIASGAAHSIVIKPALLGGLTLGQVARDLCINSKHRLRMDGPWSGDISTAALMHLSVGAPPELLIAGGDLRQKLTMPEDWGGIESHQNDRIAPGPGTGHGVKPPSLTN